MASPIWVSGTLVNPVYVVNMTSGSGGGGGGGVTASEVTGIVSGYIANGISSDIIPTASGVYDIGSTAFPFKDGYFTSGSLYLGAAHIESSGASLVVDNNVILNSGETEYQITGVPHDDFPFKDGATDNTVFLSVRRNALIVTDPTTDSIAEVDLGGTTPDPGHTVLTFIDGNGRYSVGNQGSFANNNGLITLEYINAPGQYFNINDIDGGVFLNGDRQCFGLVRESLVNAQQLNAGAAPLTGGNVGGWSMGFFWFYTGGFPYLWTTYVSAAQSPGGGANTLTGPMSSQTDQRKWWELASKVGEGKRIRVGIANGADQSGTNFGNRLVTELYVSAGMLADPDASTLLPATVITNGEGFYTACATPNNFENTQYRFRWSTFGHTTLSQLPNLVGVPNNDQIAIAAGLSYYVVYDCNATDLAAADQAGNANLAAGTVGTNNRVQTAGTTANILQFGQPYSFPNTPSGNVFPIKFTEVGPVSAGPLFTTTYDLTTGSGIRAAGTAVAPLQKLHDAVCTEVQDATTAYYLVRNLNETNANEARAYLASGLQAATAGQLNYLYDSVNATVPDDPAGSGTGGTILFPTALKTELMATLTEQLNKYPDN